MQLSSSFVVFLLCFVCVFFGQSILIVVDVFYKFATNAEVVTTEPRLPEEMQAPGKTMEPPHIRFDGFPLSFPGGSRLLIR